jgi:hypothetical protein
MYKWIILLLCAWSVRALPLEGTGSVDFRKTIIPLLDTRPEFKMFLLCNLQIVSDPMGTRIGDVAIPRLGGSVTGPYSMWVNWSGSGNSVKAVLVINTSIKYYDASGKPVENGNYLRAVSYKEEFESIEIEPADIGQLSMEPGGLKFLPDRKMCSGD